MRNKKAKIGRIVMACWSTDNSVYYNLNDGITWEIFFICSYIRHAIAIDVWTFTNVYMETQEIPQM